MTLHETTSRPPPVPPSPTHELPSAPESASVSGLRAALWRRRLPAAVLVTTVALAVAYYLQAQTFEHTDNAQIDGEITNVSTRLPGTIVAVHVRENQTVRTGDLIAELDRRDLEAALSEMQASVELARAELSAEESEIRIAETSSEAALTKSDSDLVSSRAAVAAAEQQLHRIEAELARAEADDRQAQLERTRAETLLRTESVPRARLEDMENAASASAATVEALRAQHREAAEHIAQQRAKLEVARTAQTELRSITPTQLEVRRATLSAKRARLEAALAATKQAELNLSYTRIVAPVDGIVARKMFALGDYISPGQQMVAIAQTNHLWVTANFRETQLTRVQPGQPVDIYVDALGAELRGSVEAIGGATGARLSIFPPENASGNYVKVVQRVPVRIRFDPGQPELRRLRPGMSVEPRILF